MAELPAGVADTIGKKVAGLPLWAWAAIAGAGVLTVSRIRASRNATPAPASDTASTTTPAYDTSLPSTGGTAPGGAVPPQSGGQAPGDSAGGYTYSDNSEWRRAAFLALTARGFDAVAVDQALTIYLGSGQLSQAQANMIGTALTLIGPTPQPVTLVIRPPGANPQPKPTPTPTPTPKPTPTPTGDKRPPLTLRAPLPYPYTLIRQTYGKVNAGMVGRFAAYNGLKFDGNKVTPWAVGQTVRFPAGLN